MNQPRMNVYGFPHKGIRIALSQLSKLAGNTDYSNAKALDALKANTTEIVSMLHFHAHSEETVVLPAIEARVPNSIKENIEEHELLEKEIHAFDKLLKEITIGSSSVAGAGYYLAVNNFYSKYLAHMAIEEKDMNAIIWANFTDEELLGWQGQIMSGLTPDQAMMWFKYMVPALNPFERNIMLSGFKANAPEPFFNSVIEMLKGHMPEMEHVQLVTMLNEEAVTD